MNEHGDALAPGTRIAEFEIVRELGSGGFGVTYLARDRALERMVAVKEYLPRYWGVRGPDGTVGPRASSSEADYAWGLRRFVEEARALARLRHAGIVGVHRIIEAGGTAYMVMEYVEGRSLAEEIRSSGPLPEDRVREILTGLAGGLAQVHAAGMLHRDIKPANVMLRAGDGSPVLVDFGAARQQMGRQSRSITAVLTPGYAPIEQYSARGRQGPWTDVYALGAVAYEALSGRAPDDAPERAMRDELPPVERVAASPVSAELAGAVAAALAMDAGARPQEMGELVGLLSGEGRAGEPFEIEGLPAPGPRPGRDGGATAGPDGGRQGVRRHWPLWAGGAAALAQAAALMAEAGESELLSIVILASLVGSGPMILVMGRVTGARIGCGCLVAGGGLAVVGAALTALPEIADVGGIAIASAILGPLVGFCPLILVVARIAGTRIDWPRWWLLALGWLTVAGIGVLRFYVEEVGVERTILGIPISTTPPVGPFHALMVVLAVISSAVILVVVRATGPRIGRRLWSLMAGGGLAVAGAAAAVVFLGEERSIGTLLFLSVGARTLISSAVIIVVILIVMGVFSDPGEEPERPDGVGGGSPLSRINSSRPGSANATHQDRHALEALYHAAGGPSWLGGSHNWLTDAPLGRWSGVSVDSAGRVTRLSLYPLYDRPGMIPPEIGKLTSLRRLNLHRNDLTGPISPELGKLASLRHLNLGWNRFTGGVPPELGKLPAGADVHLSYNRLTGTIPPELGKRNLDLRGNHLTGPTT